MAPRGATVSMRTRSAPTSSRISIFRSSVRAASSEPALALRSAVMRTMPSADTSARIWPLTFRTSMRPPGAMV